MNWNDPKERLFQLMQLQSLKEQKPKRSWCLPAVIGLLLFAFILFAGLVRRFGENPASGVSNRMVVLTGLAMLLITVLIIARKPE